MTVTGVEHQAADLEPPVGPSGPVDLSAAVAVGLAVLGIVGVAWWRTVGDARSMSSMVQGLAQVGRAMPFRMRLTSFAGMWVTMMTAMMLPGVAPALLPPATAVRWRAGRVASATWFAAGYLAVWASTGVLALGVLVGLRQVGAADPRWPGAAVRRSCSPASISSPAGRRPSSCRAASP
jgi:predicted metal-binding membrane protein